MNSEEAKEILLLFRPGISDRDDPEFATALEMITRNRELADWFSEHCARQQVIRDKFRRIPVPEGLKEQILSERRVRNLHLVSWASVRLTLVTVALIVLLALAGYWLPSQRENSFALFENRVPRSMLRQYPKMDLETNDLVQIRAFLGQKGRGNFVLPRGLQKATGTGCAVRQWHGQDVSMICFASGKSAMTNAPDLFLFIIDRTAVSQPPSNTSPRVRQLTHEMAIGTWVADNNAYVLAGLGDEEFLRDFF